MKVYKIIIFDLDGTLTDSQKGIIKSIQYALAKFDISEPDVEKLKKFIGPPLKNSFKTYYSFNDKTALKAIEYYREYFGEKGIYENFLYDGITYLLNGLYENGRRLMLATNKPANYMEKILKYFMIDKYFETAVGSSMDSSLTEKAEIIGKVLSHTGSLNGNNIVMIGDRGMDIAGAKKNRIDSIAVTYGYGTMEELQEAGADYSVHSVQELTTILLPK